jgi:eukaryotic-like serine/threonine-protein kinase
MDQVREGDVLDGKYRVEHVLGRGGMGTVVSAVHLQLGQRVALKLLLPEVCSNPDAVDRFLREARAAVQIHSEHVARVSDVGTLPSGAPYMVMEFLRGLDLGEVVRRRGTLGVGEAVEYVLQACEAIAEAHELGIVHRDLKPANLFLTQRPDKSAFVKVLDFGISKAMEGSLLAQSASATASAVIMGSPQYMSPEQTMSAKDVDVRTDVWSLGIILHEMLSGAPVFQGDSPTAVLIKISTVRPTPIRMIRPDVPAELERVILKCLEKNRVDRYPNIAALARALHPFAPEHARVSVERIGRIQDGGNDLASAPTWSTGGAARVETGRAWGHTQSSGRRGRAGAFALVAVLGCGFVVAGIMLATRSPATAPATGASSPSMGPPTVQAAEDPSPPASSEPVPTPAKPIEPVAARPVSSSLASAKTKLPSAPPRRVARPKDLFDDPK